jgi:hypothetical protein
LAVGINRYHIFSFALGASSGAVGGLIFARASERFWAFFRGLGQAEPRNFVPSPPILSAETGENLFLATLKAPEKRLLALESFVLCQQPSFPRHP